MSGERILIVEDDERIGSKLLRALNELWTIAYGEKAAAIAPSRWRDLQETVVYVAREAETGSWKFLPNGSDA